MHYAPDRSLTEAIGPRADVTTTCFDLGGHVTDVVDALDGTRRWTYDSVGRAVSATDELGATTRFPRTTTGMPAKIVDPLGRTTTLTYHATLELPTVVTDPEGGTVTVAYNANGLPETVTRDKGANTLDIAEYTYTADGMPETITEAGGAVTTFDYDSRGYLTSVTDAEGREVTTVVDARGFVESSVGAAGNAAGGVPADHRTEYTYDAMGRVLTVTDPLDNTTTYTYDDMGRLETVETPLGLLTTFELNDAGQVLSATREISASVDAVEEYEYDADGNVTAAVDAEDRRTEYTYDLLGRLIETKDAAGEDWAVEYDAKSRPVEATDPTGRSTARTYDPDTGLLTSTIDEAGEATTFAYQALTDRLVSVTDPLDHVTTYGYDWLGRQTSITDPADEVTELTYYASGDVHTTTDARDHTTTFEYNDAHQLTSVLDADQGETTFAYDEAGLMETRTNARSYDETYEYDRLGRPTKLTDAIGKFWRTFYDADGRVDHTIDGKGQTTEFEYDGLGNLLSVDPATGSTITYDYDKTSRLESMTDGAGTTTYTYRTAGPIATVSRGSRTTTYTYDDARRPLTVVYPGSGGTVGYAYDDAGRLETITDWNDRTTTFSYDDASRVTSVARPGGLVTDFEYDQLNRPTTITHARSGSTLLELVCAYDPVGNLESLTDDAGTATFTYDELDRLTDAAYPGGQDYAYGYDSVGNILSAETPSGTTNYTYDAADRITSGGTAPTYDDNGNMTTDGSYGGRTYTYDALGRLTGVSGTGLTASYTLDGQGNRVSATVNSTTTDFDLDLNRVLPTVLMAGGRKYLPGQPQAGYEESGTWWNALANHQGTILRYVDTGGNLSATYRYDPYGGARPSSTVPAGFGYTGEWADATGLTNLRARAYDPVLGRFIGRDTFGGVASAPLTGNRYAYGLDNPLRYTDPSGHFASAFNADPGFFLSLGLQMIPVVGDAYSFFIGSIGYDPIAGIHLSPQERLLAIGSVLAIGGGFHALSRFGDEVPWGRVGEVGALRQADEVGAVSTATRYGDQLRSPLRVREDIVGVRGLPEVTVARPATGGARVGHTVPALGQTSKRYSTYLTDVARHYGINLRGVRPVFDDTLSSGVKGLTLPSEGGWIIRIHPGFSNEADLANTIAHELRHARDVQKGLLSREGPAYASGDALEEWIHGRR